MGEIAGRLLGARRTVRLARFGKTPGALVWQPKPPGSGDAAAARRLASGVLLFDGRLVETTDPTPWALTGPDRVWTDALHGHGWLDDAEICAQDPVWAALIGWVWSWIDRYAQGSGPGWQPDLVARRLTRWIAYSVRILRGQPKERSDRFFQALGLQTRYLSLSWRQTANGLARIEALTGLVYAMLSLEGTGRSSQRVIRALGDATQAAIGPDGAIPSRNPEELARIFALLTWSARGIEDAGLSPSKLQLDGLKRVAPVLAALRHGNGTLARFNGGGTGRGLNLDAMLKEARMRGPAPLVGGPAMGYLRLQTSHATAIVDAGSAPSFAVADTIHASGLGLEFTHTDQPIIVNCGSGLAFGDKPARAARRRPSASSVELCNRCPALLVPGSGQRPDGNLHLTGSVTGQLDPDPSGPWALCKSTEYLKTTGLVIERRVHMTPIGNRLVGEDTVLATTAEGRSQAAALLEEAGQVPITARFHIHPDVQVVRPASGTAIVMNLPDGTRWRVLIDADTTELVPSQFFDPIRPKPRAAIQIVATAHLIDYWGRITWSFEKLSTGAAPG
ncbi:MAG: heparinase II/III family protein [Pseudomonadota bacterium]